MNFFTQGTAYGRMPCNGNIVHPKSIRIFLMLFLFMSSFLARTNAQGRPPACDVISAGSSCNSELQGLVNQQIPYTANLVNNVGATYAWEFITNSSGAYIKSGQGTLNPVINTGGNEGQYTLRLTVSGPQGTSTCSSSLVVGCFTTNATFTPISCWGGTSTLTVTATGSTGPYTYLLQPGNISNNTGMFTGLHSGTYTVGVTSADPGCTSVMTVVITQPSLALTATTTQTNVNCYGASTGAVNLNVSGGTTAYTYSWVTTAGGVIPAGQQDDEDLSGLVRGTYRVFVTDANGCGTMATVFITQPVQALWAPFVQVNPGCGDSVGIINLSPFGGTAPYTYFWSAASGGVIPAGQEDDQDLYGIMGGTYTVVVTDAVGCTYTNAAIILQTMAATSTQVNVGCRGDSTGRININVFGGVQPYEFAWTATNGGYVATAQAAMEDLSGLPAGTYHVIVKDINDCSTSKDVVITQPSTALAASSTQTNVGCVGGSTGSINLSVSGGTVPYIYNWLATAGGVIPAGQEDDQDLSGLVSGTYRVFVTDSAGCSAVETVMITQPVEALSASYVQVNPGCDSVGTINLTAFGGTAPYNYVWTATNGGVVPAGQANGNLLYNIIAGTYTVVVTDQNGCIVTRTAVITQGAAAINATYTQTNAGCGSGSGGSINLTVSGGTTPYTYLWTATNGGIVPAGQSANEDLSGLVAGTYNVVIIAANGCSDSQTIIITQSGSSDISITATPANVLCHGGATGAINILVNGGAGQYIFQWTAALGGNIPAGQVNSQNLTGLTAGVYTVHVTDASGCTKHKTVIVTQPFPILLTAIEHNPGSCSSNNGSINLVLAGGTAPYTYVWTATNGGVVPALQVNNQDLTGLVAGSYTVAVTTANGCTGSKTFTLSCNQPHFGCSHGYWKNHPEHWNQLTDYTPAHMPANMRFITTTDFFAYFNIAPGTSGLPNSLTMLGALQLQGGHCKAFSRDAVTALLDIASGQNVPLPVGINDFGGMYSAIRTALLTGDCNGDLRSALSAIVNSCHDDGDDDDDDRMNPVVNNTVTVSSYPNPFDSYTGKINFKIRSEVAGNATFELYDLLGVRLAVLYNGRIEKNVEKLVSFTVPSVNKKTLIYKMRVGDKITSGKVLFLN